MPKINENKIPLIEIFDAVLKSKNTHLFILREDLTHPEISGNKWRKLKYNLLEAQEKGFKQLLTFGGAYSNHIAATAAAGRDFGIKTIGIIRGEETLPLNTTLQTAKDNGMVFKYVSRSQYRENNKYEESFLAALNEEFGNFYIVPEGGSNAFAVNGCTEIINNITIDFDVICSACGTGGTLAGIIASTEKQVLGFPALKGGEFLKEDIQKLITAYAIHYNIELKNNNWSLVTDYHFGGYAKITAELVEFVQQFKIKHHILLDLIYTGKMLFGLFDMIKNSNRLDNKTIIAVHTGGIQGNKGFDERLSIKI